MHTFFTFHPIFSHLATNRIKIFWIPKTEILIKMWMHALFSYSLQYNCCEYVVNVLGYRCLLCYFTCRDVIQISISNKSLTWRGFIFGQKRTFLSRQNEDILLRINQQADAKAMYSIFLLYALLLLLGVLHFGEIEKKQFLELEQRQAAVGDLIWGFEWPTFMTTFPRYPIIA